MRQLSYAEVARRRSTLGQSALLFLTDRCPVGCAHCSVDSRPDGPRVADLALFGEIVDALCGGGFGLVGISGGEPFAERRALTLATGRLAAAGIDIAVYTSGFWATADGPPGWIRAVLRRCSCVFLSTDAFHEQALAGDRFVLAARAIAAQGRWIVAQVLAEPPMVRRATELLERALGAGWAEHAELNAVPPLRHGRAAGLFPPAQRRPGSAFARPCSLVHSPVVRYDGVVTACCNEAVLMGAGPAGLRRRCRSGAEVSAALRDVARAPLLGVIRAVGPGRLTVAPGLADLAERRFSGICDLCWTVVDRLDRTPDRVVEAVGALERSV